jgi:hypothetical protein
LQQITDAVDVGRTVLTRAMMQSWIEEDRIARFELELDVVGARSGSAIPGAVTPAFVRLCFANACRP